MRRAGERLRLARMKEQLSEGSRISLNVDVGNNKYLENSFLENELLFIV